MKSQTTCIFYSIWLKENVAKAQMRVSACNPVRQEIERLSNILVKGLELNEIVWDCGWGLSHLRGCLQSFYSLAQQFPLEINILRGESIIPFRVKNCANSKKFIK